MRPVLLMLINPPPSRCERCGASSTNPDLTALAAGDPSAWILLEGPDTTVTLADGRTSLRRGRGWVCRRCGHEERLSRELPR